MSSDATLKPLALLIDDVANFRDALAALLEKEGCETVAYSDGVAALRAIHENSVPIPDVVFLDLRMPGINGYQFLESLRGIAEYATVPVIILSFAVDPAEIARAMSLGATDHIDKSEMSRQVVFDVLRRYVKRE